MQSLACNALSAAYRQAVVKFGRGCSWVRSARNYRAARCQAWAPPRYALEVPDETFAPQRGVVVLGLVSLLMDTSPEMVHSVLPRCAWSACRV